jgi:DNA primase
MIPQAFIQDLLHRVDIVDVVDRFVKLKRAGANHVACCPFHSEKSPSFTVSQVKQFYHCFGCGAHGTAIGFMMEYSGLGFVDAVKDLAQSVGMTVPEAPRSEHSQRRSEQSEDLHAVLLTAARFYRAQLKDAPRAIEYLKRRGLSGDVAKRFGVGYAPEGWQALAAAFPDYNAKALATAGLVKQNDEGRRFDLFRDRIVFPIVDVRGNVIGFGGRVLDARNDPKYLNSPETPVFEKGRELYGLYQARRAIRDAGRVLVVEGYMDVVALAQHEVGYAVATLGTATTGIHVQKLLRQSDEVVFCFDGDSAGRRAARKALEVSLPELVDGKQVRFLFLPQGDDPDSYVRAHGKAGFEAMVERAVPLSRCLLDELTAAVDLTSAEGRASLIHSAKPLITQLQNNMFRVQILRELAEKSRLTPEEVAALCGLPSVERKRAAPAPKAGARSSAPLWRKLLRLLVDAPHVVETLTAEQRRLLAGNADFGPAMTLVEEIEANGITSTAALFEATRESPYAELYHNVATESMESPTHPEEVRSELEGVFEHLEVWSVKTEYERLLSKPEKSEAERLRFQQLSRRLSELRGAGGVGLRSPT